MTHQGNLPEYHRTRFLNLLVSAMDDKGYKLYVMWIPKDETQDLPILTDGNITIGQAKVVIMTIQIINNSFLSYCSGGLS